tara:strand:+ start:349 stop:1152 length:804 start_codon:yes stop_codon:yes gene_type:complete
MDASKYFDNANSSEKTLKTYKSLYENHLKQFIGSSNPVKVAKKIKKLDVSNNTIMTILSLYINIVKANGYDVGELKDIHKQLFDVKKKDTIERKLVKSNLPTFKELNDYLNYTYKQQQWKHYIANYLLITFTTRNEDLNLKFVSSMIDTDKTNNFLVVRKSDIVFLRNKYKTSKSYGQIKRIIKTKKFVTACHEFVKTDTQLFPSDDHLHEKITRLTFQNVSESDICKIVVSEIDLNKNYKKLEAVSANRGTSPEVLIDNYRLADRT